jgi:hypothetical protein
MSAPRFPHNRSLARAAPAEARAAPRALPTPAQWLEMQGFITVNWPAIHAWLGALSALLVRRARLVF